MSRLDRLRQDNLLREREFREYVLFLESLLLGVTALGVVYLLAVPNPRYRVLIVFAPPSVAALAGLFITWGVYRMQPWTRRPLVAMCLVGLPLFPFGTLFALRILQIAFTGKHPQFLTNDYYDIVQKTRHLNPRTSVLTWIGLVLIVVLLLSVAVIWMLPSEVWLR